MLSKVSSRLTALITFNHSSLMLRKTVDSYCTANTRKLLIVKLKVRVTSQKRRQTRQISMCVTNSLVYLYGNRDISILACT